MRAIGSGRSQTNSARPYCATEPVRTVPSTPSSQKTGSRRASCPQADNVSHWLKSRTGAARSGVEWMDRLRLVG